MSNRYQKAHLEGALSAYKKLQNKIMASRSISSNDDGELLFGVSTLKAAVEFGFKGKESGHNLQKVLEDFDKVLGD